MKVFISWSGEPSASYAQVLHAWVPQVLQYIRPYCSQKGIAKGARWADSIGNELEESALALLCLTRDNQHEPWLNFEAGSVAKVRFVSRVCPILFDVKATEITGPLAQFQSTDFVRDEMKKLVASVNECAETAERVELSVLERAFDKWWPDLEREISSARAAAIGPASAPSRTAESMLEEILALLRHQTTSGQGVVEYGNLVARTIMGVEQYAGAIRDDIARLRDELEVMRRSASFDRGHVDDVQKRILDKLANEPSHMRQIRLREMLRDGEQERRPERS
jgi:hypothetical protein